MKDFVSAITYFLILQILLCNLEAYDLKCPLKASWKIRAESKCNSTLKYFCLYNNVEETYVEGCNGPDWDRKGSKRIFSGSFTRGNCHKTRFQPFYFQTNESMSDCIYAKSLCSEEGHISYIDDSTREDRTCRCDYKKNYSFIKTPRNLCYCIPTKEDCSCYIKLCPVNFTLSADYECTQTIYKDKQKCVEMTKYDKQNDENTRVHMENDTLRLELQSSKCLWSGLNEVTVLVLLCLILITVAWGFCFAVALGTWIIAKLQSCKVFFLKNKTADPEYDEERHLRKLSSRTTEEVNYLRMIHLLYSVACPIVLMVFNSVIKPSQLRQTLDENKIKLEKQHRKKKTFINDSQLRLLYKVQTVTSEDFDLRLMLNILKLIKVDDSYPLPYDKSTSTMLSRIEYIRNETTHNCDGKLSSVQFNRYWNDIGQAVITLVARQIQEKEYDGKNTQLHERLLWLNPINFGNRALRKYIFMSEIYSALIIEKLIAEYCEYKKQTIQDILTKEKHNLYHKRFKTESCCECESDLEEHVKELSEKHWQALFDTIGDNGSHSCPCKLQHCSKRFVPKKNISMRDVSLTVSLVLNIPDILIHNISENEFYNFVKKNKHTIYHYMEKKKCCACIKDPTETIIINENEWNILFEKQNEKSCQTTETENCCCEYSIRHGLECSKVDRTVLSKIFRVAGPISVLSKIGQDAFLQFLSWTVDNKPLQGALTELLHMVTDKTFCDVSVFSNLLQLENNTIYAKIDLDDWFAKHQWKDTAKTELPLMIHSFNKGKRLHIRSLEVPKDFSSPCKTTKFKNITTEENNFLVAVYVFTKVVYPTIYREFKTLSPDYVLNATCGDDYSKQLATNVNTDGKESRKVGVHLSVDQQRQPFLPPREESQNLDIELMIYILKKRFINESNKLYIDQLDVIEKIRREIFQSKNGILEQTQFEDIVSRISKAVLHMKGDTSEKELLNLQEIRII